MLSVIRKKMRRKESKSSMNLKVYVRILKTLRTLRDAFPFRKSVKINELKYYESKPFK